MKNLQKFGFSSFIARPTSYLAEIPSFKLQTTQTGSVDLHSPPSSLVHRFLFCFPQSGRTVKEQNGSPQEIQGYRSWSWGQGNEVPEVEKWE